MHFRNPLQSCSVQSGDDSLRTSSPSSCAPPAAGGQDTSPRSPGGRSPPPAADCRSLCWSWAALSPRPSLSPAAAWRPCWTGCWTCWLPPPAPGPGPWRTARHNTWRKVTIGTNIIQLLPEGFEDLANCRSFWGLNQPNRSPHYWIWAIPIFHQFTVMDIFLKFPYWRLSSPKVKEKPSKIFLLSNSWQL